MRHSRLLPAAMAAVALCALTGPADATVPLDHRHLEPPTAGLSPLQVADPGPPVAKPQPTGPDGRPRPAPGPRPPSTPTPPEWCFPGETRCPLLPVPYPNF